MGVVEGIAQDKRGVVRHQGVLQGVLGTCLSIMRGSSPILEEMPRPDTENYQTMRASHTALPYLQLQR